MFLELSLVPCMFHQNPLQVLLELSLSSLPAILELFVCFHYNYLRGFLDTRALPVMSCRMFSEFIFGFCLDSP